RATRGYHRTSNRYDGLRGIRDATVPRHAVAFHQLPDEGHFVLRPQNSRYRHREVFAGRRSMFRRARSSLGSAAMRENTAAAGRPNEGWMQSSTCRAVNAEARAEGRAYGLAETMSRTMARLLSRQAKQRFGSADPAGRATLDGLAQAFACGALEELAERL